jgi:hypothetical protein
MAELYWEFQQYEMSAAAEDIGDVYGALSSAMGQNGWEGVQHQGDVHGYKPGIDLFAAIAFLEIGTGTTFWQAIAVGGGMATQAQAQQEIQELQSIIANLEFL